MPWMLIVGWCKANWKLLAYVGAGLAIFWCIRVYGNKQWEKGVEYGDSRTQVKLEAQYKQKWAEDQKQLDIQRRQLADAVKTNDATRIDLAARQAELARARQNIAIILERATAMAEASIEAGYNTAGAVPDPALVDAIRAISADLERDRAAGHKQP